MPTGHVAERASSTLALVFSLLAVALFASASLFFFYVFILGLWGLPYLVGQELAVIGGFYLALLLISDSISLWFLKKVNLIRKALKKSRLKGLKSRDVGHWVAVELIIDCAFPIIVLLVIKLPANLASSLLPGLIPHLLADLIIPLYALGIFASAVAGVLILVLRDKLMKARGLRQP